MELCDGGDLLQKIEGNKKRNQLLPEAEVWKYFIQMLRGLKGLHDLQIVHRDIKCANLFITKSGDLKLGDLNVSKVAKEGMLSTQTGTPYYASPEVWNDKPYNEKSDLWSLGCVLYELVTGKPPFQAADMSMLFKRITRGAYQAIGSQYSQDLSHVIKCMLQQTPSHRPSC